MGFPVRILESDGFSRTDCGNKNREQLIPAGLVACANREQKQETQMSLLIPQHNRTTGVILAGILKS